MSLQTEFDGMTNNEMVILIWIGISWIIHVVVCIASAQWLFLIAGAIAFPVAVVHGTWITAQTILTVI